MLSYKNLNGSSAARKDLLLGAVVVEVKEFRGRHTENIVRVMRQFVQGDSFCIQTSPV